jgi:hypothetical protein
VTIEIIATPRAQQQIDDLSRAQAKTFDAFLDDLATTGCRALAYRLTGPTPLNRMCVKHLRDSLRVVVAFETPQRAWVLLVGPHDDADPSRNVYAELYELLDAYPQTRQGAQSRHAVETTASHPASVTTSPTSSSAPRGNDVRARAKRRDHPRHEPLPSLRLSSRHPSCSPYDSRELRARSMSRTSPGKGASRPARIVSFRAAIFSQVHQASSGRLNLIFGRIGRDGHTSGSLQSASDADRALAGDRGHAE